MKHESNSEEPSNHGHSLGRCKVCTKQIREGENHAKVYQGSTCYIVCCASCAAKFSANPDAYLVE